MSKNTAHHQSALASFQLGFEYDMSWADAKKSLKSRTA